MRRNRSEPPRVALFGQFGTGNFGNDASLLAAIRGLRANHPDVDISVLCYDPDSVTRLYDLPATTIRGDWAKSGSRSRFRLLRGFRRVSDFLRMYRLTRRLDVVMVPGSGLFEAGRHGPGSVASLLFSTALATRLAGKQFAVVSVGADAAERKSTRILLGWTLRLATYRSFRDEHSRRSAVGFGASCGSDPVYPDLAFGLDVPDDQVGPNAPESVGVGVLAYHGPFSYDKPSKREPAAAAYLDSLTSFVEWLLERGLFVTLFGGDLKDEKIAEDVRGRVLSRAPEAWIDIARVESYNDVLQLLHEVDYAVGTRYHNIVGAVMTGTPVISINYRAKNGELLNDIGLDRFHQPLQQLDGERLRVQFADLQRSADDVAARMAAKCRNYRAATELEWSNLMAIIAPDRSERGREPRPA